MGYLVGDDGDNNAVPTGVAAATYFVDSDANADADEDDDDA